MFFHFVQSLRFLLPWQEYKFQDSSVSSEECPTSSATRKNRSFHKTTLSCSVSTVGFQLTGASMSYTMVCIFYVVIVRVELVTALSHHRILFPFFITTNCVCCSGFHQPVKSLVSLPYDPHPGILPSFASQPSWKNAFFFKGCGMT